MRWEGHAPAGPNFHHCFMNYRYAFCFKLYALSYECLVLFADPWVAPTDEILPPLRGSIFAASCAHFVRLQAVTNNHALREIIIAMGCAPMVKILPPLRGSICFFCYRGLR